jgi:hypothetical protein
VSWLAPFAQAWLVAVCAGLGLPLGALALLMIHQLTGGLWGEEARPVLRRIAGLLPLMLLCGLPLIAAIELLMPFLTAPPETLPERVTGKLHYLQPAWIIFRTLVVAGLWLVALATGERSRRWAVWGLIFYMLGLLVFTTDWMQALEPTYYSTIYPVEVAGAQIQGALALAILLLPRDIKGDFGKILIGTILSWSYFAGMQWLITWMGDLPPEAAWYKARTADWWGAVLIVMCLLFAIVPFFALLRGRVRGSLADLRRLAWMLLAGYVLEDVWRIAPAFPANGLVAVALLAMAGIVWTALARRRARLEAGHV